LIIRGKGNLREGELERVYSLAVYKDIPIQNNSDFSKRFYLLGNDPETVKEVFINDLVHFFETNPYYHVESNGCSLIVFSKERMASVKEIKALLDFSKRLK